MTTPHVVNDAGTAEVGSPSAGPAGDEFVIVDAPMPDHTASADDEIDPAKRSDDRTAKLLDIARSGKRGPGRPRKEATEKAKKPVPPMPRAGFVKPLTEMYGTIALAMMPFDAECAMAVMEAAPKCAESLDNLARQNPAVRRVLVALTNTTAIGAVLAAHAPIILAITVHHVPAVRDSGMGTMIKAMMENNSQ